MKDLTDFNEDDVAITITVGDCFGEPTQLSVYSENKVMVDEVPVPAIMVFQDARFRSYGSIYDWGYCVRLPVDELLKMMKALGYKVEKDPGGGSSE